MYCTCIVSVHEMNLAITAEVEVYVFSLLLFLTFLYNRSALKLNCVQEYDFDLEDIQLFSKF